MDKATGAYLPAIYPDTSIFNGRKPVSRKDPCPRF